MKNKDNLKLFWYYMKNYKFELFLYIFLVIFTYLPELISVYIWGLAIEFLTKQNFNSFLILLFLYDFLFVFAYTIVQIPRDALYTFLEINFTKNVSKDMYKKLDKLPAIAFEEIGVGEFTNRLYTDPDRIMELLSRLIRTICKSIMVIVVLIFTFRISFVLGLEVLIFAIVMYFISKKFFPKIKKSHEDIKKESDNYVKTITENITGIREIKSLGIKQIIEDKVGNILDKLYVNIDKIRVYERWYYALANLAYFVIQFIIFATAGKYFIDGKIAISIFMTLSSCIWRIDEIVQSISDFGVNYNKVMVSLKRINEILKNKLYPDEVFGNVNLEDCQGIIEFKNVQFKYKEDEKNTLKGLNLKLEPFKKNALVGKSGNGKSTIFNLLLRYFDSTKGEILIDNINIKDLTEESLRNNISIIRQSPFLFNLSIIDNFKIVKENVTLEEIRNVCKKAYIDEYIISLPNGYETIIGEGGINLSGGQKQRIAIARTLLLNTKIILFDEATSALDNESQEYIKKTIDNLVKEHTVIIVAHRLSTIVDADVIGIIDDGKLKGLGKHKELLKNNDIYKNLYLNSGE